MRKAWLLAVSLIALVHLPAKGDDSLRQVRERDRRHPRFERLGNPERQRLLPGREPQRRAAEHVADEERADERIVDERTDSY